MNFIRTIAIAVCASIALTAFASSPDGPRTGAQLHLDVFGRAGVEPFASAVPGGSLGSWVVFLDEELRFAAYLAIIPAGSRSTDSMQRWWDHFQITIADEHSVVRKLVGRDLHLLEARVNGKMVSGTPSNYAAVWDEKANIIRFTIAPLPPGDYVARAEFHDPAGPTLTSGPAFFVIRRGDEDRAMVRLYLRKEADEARTYDAYKAIMLRLHELEPENAGIIENIAEHSLNIAPPAESLAWFRQAREMREAGAARHRRERGDKLTTEERRSMDEQLASVSLFEKVYPDYVAHQQDRRLVIIGGGRARQYAWFTKDGRMIGVIDLYDPSIVRPINLRPQQ